MTSFEDESFERDLFAARARALPMPESAVALTMTAENAIARARSQSPRARVTTQVIQLSRGARAAARHCRAHASAIVALGAAAACVAWVFTGPRVQTSFAMHDPAENEPIASFADTSFEPSSLTCEAPSRFERLQDMSSAFFTSARAALSEEPIATRDDHDLRVCKDDSAKEIACGRDVTCEVATP